MPAPRSALPPDREHRRYLALWFPHLPTDRFRSRFLSSGRRDDAPLVLVDSQRGALRITALDARAAGLGLTVGMPLAEARALLPGLATAPADPLADRALLHACAAACEMFTPLVGLRGEEGLILDVTGCTHLFGGEHGMLQAVRQRLADLRLSSRAALAGTPDAAWAFAGHLRGGVAAPGTDGAIARALPIAALGLDTGTALALARAGFRTLADLDERPSAMLAARFGMALVDRLNRVLGREDIRITPLRPLPQIMAEKHFSEPVAHLESLCGVLERLAGDVVARLGQRGEGGRVFEASFFRADGAVRRLVIETAAPTRDMGVLMRLMRLRIDALADPLDPGFGFDAIRLGVQRGETLAEAQADLAGENRAGSGDAIADLVGRLVARFGREQVRRFIARDTHDPVRAGGTVSCLAAPESGVWPEPEPGQPPARPLTLFEPPQLIEVLAEVPDSPPLRFRWRRVLHEVTQAEGPERIAPEWWREAAAGGNQPPATRDYYRVEDAAGHRFWIFREGLYEDSTARPRWFLHGLFA